jgi:hypothetical protein
MLPAAVKMKLTRDVSRSTLVNLLMLNRHSLQDF